MVVSDSTINKGAIESKSLRPLNGWHHGFYAVALVIAVLGPRPLPEIAIFILILLNSLRMTLLRSFVQVVLLACAIGYGFLIGWTVERIPDLKLFMLLAAVLGYCYSRRNIRLDIIISLFIYINVALITYTLAFHGSIIRYTNSLTFAGQTSIYIGFVAFCLYTAANTKQKFMLALLMLMINSGTVLVGLVAYEVISIFTRTDAIKKNAFKKIAGFIGTVAVVALLWFALLISQEETRGRSLSALTSIDRVVLSNNALQFLKRNFDVEHYLFGCYWSCDLKKLTTEFDITYSPTAAIVRDYAALEGQGYIQPKNVHSDAFRTILAFGMLGFFLTYVVLYLALKRDLAVFGSVFLMGLLNNLLYVTPCMLGILLIIWGKETLHNKSKPDH